MNPMVKNMVDLLFQDVAENEEVKALHDELMDNCQERYQDLVAGGLPEDEALEAVTDSLAGMQEVIDQYPRKEPVPEGTAEAPADESEETEQEKTAEAGEDEADEMTFSAEEIRKIRADAGAHDVRVLPSEDGAIHICCENLKNLRVTRNGDTLNVEVIRLTEEVSEAAEESFPNGERIRDMTIGSLLNGVKKMLDSAVKTVIRRVSESNLCDDSEIEIRVPSKDGMALDLNTGSGDLDAEMVKVNDLSLRSASGDIEAACVNTEMMDRLYASTASGDIHVTSAWAREGTLSSISGDVNLEGDFGTLLIKSVSGDAEFSGTALNVQGKAVSGDVELNLLECTEGEIGAESTSGDVEIHLPENCGSVHAECSSTVGQIHVGCQDAGAEAAQVKIRARTVSGDIHID